MGYFKYIKVNYIIDDFLDLRQVKDRWYKFDFLFDWENFKTDFFVDNTFRWSSPFHHGEDKYAVGQGQTPTFKGVDSLVLYTLSPEGISEFMDLKLCKERCQEEF